MFPFILCSGEFAAKTIRKFAGQLKWHSTRILKMPVARKNLLIAGKIPNPCSLRALKDIFHNSGSFFKKSAGRKVRNLIVRDLQQIIVMSASLSKAQRRRCLERSNIQTAARYYFNRFKHIVSSESEATPIQEKVNAGMASVGMANVQEKVMANVQEKASLQKPSNVQNPNDVPAVVFPAKKIKKSHKKAAPIQKQPALKAAKKNKKQLPIELVAAVLPLANDLPTSTGLPLSTVLPPATVLPLSTVLPQKTKKQKLTLAEQKQKPSAEKKQKLSTEQKEKPSAEQKQKPSAEKKEKPSAEKKQKPSAEKKQKQCV